MHLTLQLKTKQTRMHFRKKILYFERLRVFGRHKELA